MGDDTGWVVSLHAASGVSCEGRVGDFYAENPDVRAAVQQIFTSVDVVSVSDLSGWGERLEADESAVEYGEVIAEQSDSPGTTTPAEVINGMAVSQAVIETVSQELSAQGLHVRGEQPDLSAGTKPVRRGSPVSRRATGPGARGIDNLSLNAADLSAYFEHRSRGAEAADLLSETMVTAWRQMNVMPEGSTQARMWLFGIARDVLANAERSAQRRWKLADKLRAHIITEPVADGDHRTNVEVRDAVNRLPSQLQELIGLIHWDGFSITEAAGIVGIPASTARTRYQAARQQLARALSLATG